jgi:hypothetical protein
VYEAAAESCTEAAAHQRYLLADMGQPG